MPTTAQTMLASIQVLSNQEIQTSSDLHPDTGSRIVAYMRRHGIDSYALSQSLYFPADDNDRAHIRRVVAILRRGQRR